MRARMYLRARVFVLFFPSLSPLFIFTLYRRKFEEHILYLAARLLQVDLFGQMDALKKKRGKEERKSHAQVCVCVCTP